MGHFVENTGRFTEMLCGKCQSGLHVTNLYDGLGGKFALVHLPDSRGAQFSASCRLHLPTAEVPTTATEEPGPVSGSCPSQPSSQS